MDSSDKLKNIIARQKELLSALEAESKVLESSDLTRENRELKADIEKLRGNYEAVKNDVTRLTGENANLKSALYEQISGERVKLINATTKKLSVYFRSTVDGELNRLSAFENAANNRITTIRNNLSRNNISLEDEIHARLNEVALLAQNKVAEARARITEDTPFLDQDQGELLQAMKDTPLTKEQIQTIAKSNSLERWVGLNILNWIGIFLLIVGVIAVGQFTYFRVPDLVKGIMLFSLGGSLLVAGEILNRRKPNVFSLGISAGGIAILYAALVASYFGLHILSMYTALGLCVFMTTGAFVLATRYNSQIIIIFALIGGYLPMFSLGNDTFMLYGAMVYFLALNILALLIAFRKKWRVTAFVGLFLNMIGTIMVITLMPGTGDSLWEKLILITYTGLAFLIYLAIPIVSTWRTGERFRRSDIVLMGINTVCSSLIMYGLFPLLDLQDYNGLFALGFAASYLLLGLLVGKLFAREDQYAKALFIITGLAFAVFFVPLQFGRIWLSLGWLIEGVLLAAYGILFNAKRFKLAGLVIGGFCLAAFCAFDLMWAEYARLFIYKYSALTLGSLIVLGTYAFRKRLKSDPFAKVYKYFVMVNVWAYVLYIIAKAFEAFKSSLDVVVYSHSYLLNGTMIVATFLLAFVLPRLKAMADLGTRILAAVLHVIGIVWLSVLNAWFLLIDPTGIEIGIMVGTVVILTALGLLSMLALRDFLKVCMAEAGLSEAWYALIMAGYFALVLTLGLISQFQVSFTHFSISIIYVLMALAWIVFGFLRRTALIRRCGLGLAILAVVKLFIVDLYGLAQGYRIISYFALGISLIAISFVYQYFHKRLQVTED
ncbi:MAG: DUF2339 domain-containing protein [Peptococcaceae bacterium]|nr:DUF2339 domain-containing protein [Peptococcaceae bacterium]